MENSIIKNNLEAYCFPMIARDNLEREDSTEEILTRWKRFNFLSEEKQEILISENTASIIKNIGQKFFLPTEKIRKISIIVRDLFFEKISVKHLSYEISRRIPELKNNQEKIAKIILEEIFYAKNKPKEIIKNLIKISLSEALKKFPEAGEQLITSEKIMLKNFPEPVRPSIKNWLADYTYSTGYESHDSAKRGNYLFQNENAKKLNSFEKGKLSFILRAYDENSAIEINIDTRQIVFPNNEIQNRTRVFEKKNVLPKIKPASINSNQPQNENKMRFSSPQKMSYETKNNFSQNQSLNSQPRQFIKPQQNLNNNRNIPASNVVNLKEQ